jgi:hypothetical protein
VDETVRKFFETWAAEGRAVMLVTAARAAAETCAGAT